MAELRRRGAARPAATASSATSDFAETFKKMDVYPKTLDEFNEKTTLGGAISIISLTIIALLIVSELAAYFRVNTADHLSVDVEREREIRINLNISFPSLPCAGISLVTMDVAGEQQIDVVQNVKKSRLSADGRWLGPDDASAEGADGAGGGDERCGVCYSDPELQRQFVETVQREVAEAREQGKKINPGFASTCCNTCDDVRAAYGRVHLARSVGADGAEKLEQADWKEHALCQHDAQLIDPASLADIHEGCNVYGHLQVNKVAGNFHVAPGRAFASAQGHLVHEFKPFEMSSWNTSHAIHSLSFGPSYKGQLNPLDGVAKLNAHGSALYQYYVKVVPTTYRKLGGRVLHSCQYSVTEAVRTIDADAGRSMEFVLPGVFFIYDISPIKVSYEESRTSFWAFITSLCAIIGGVYVVAGMVDAALYSVGRKSELAIKY